MNLLLKYFPRQLNLFRVEVNNKKDLYNYINQCNSKIDCYYSLYDIENYFIDKIAYDLDNDNALKNIRKLHKYFLKEDIKHIMFFSGRGFHFYFFTKNYENIINKNESLKNVQLFFINKLNLTYGFNGEDVDSKLIGDIKRMIRFPNTLNKKSNLYEIPLTHELIKKNIFFIKEEAKRQNFTFIYYGNKLIDLKQFDFIEENKKSNDMGVNNNIFIKNASFDYLLPCMQQMLLQPKKVKNNVRFYFAKGCNELLVSPDNCNKFAKEYWSDELDSTGRKTKYEEFIKEKQIDYAYNSTQSFYPSCKVLKKLKLCLVEDCGKQIYK